MIIQAAKIIGSGLATIGLIVILMLNSNKGLLLFNIIYSKLAKEAISTCEVMVRSLRYSSIVLDFLKKEIPLSILKINGSITNNPIVVIEVIPLDSKVKNIDFLIELLVYICL